MKESQNGGKKEGPNKPRNFPNYLLTKQNEEATRQRAPQSSAFVADELLDATPSVPFLDRNKDGLRRHPDKKPDMKLEKDYFVMEQKRFNKEKRMVREQQRWQLNGSIYQSRRPFKATEFPSLWNSKVDKKSVTSVDFKQIRMSMVIPVDQLILIDTDPPAENVAAEEESTKKTAPKKALHRSLKGIMEQEKVQKNWDLHPKQSKNPHPSGYRSYFD